IVMAEIINFSELAQRRSGPPAGRAAGAAPTAAAPVDQRRSFAFLIERYLLHHQREHSSPKTLDIYRSALEGTARFFEECGGRTARGDPPCPILEHAGACRRPPRPDRAREVGRFPRQRAPVRSLGPRLLQLVVRGGVHREVRAVLRQEETVV